MKFVSVVPAACCATRPTAYGPLAQWQREVDRVLGQWLADSGGAGGGHVAPPVDVSETDQSIEVSMDLPGIPQEAIEVELTDGVLRVHGEKPDVRHESKDKWHRVERVYGTFERSLRLPAEVVSEQIDATVSNGVLKITLPKRDPHVATKKIVVKTA